MTIKTITGTYAGGYSLSSNYSGLNIASTAEVGGDGVYLGQTGSVVNLGTVITEGYDGVVLADGGSVTNSNVIYGHIGIATYARNSASPTPSAILNTRLGYIGGGYIGVFMAQNGQLSNYGAIIAATFGVVGGEAATVSNFGVIQGGRAGVYAFGDADRVYNGDKKNTTALIEGREGIILSSGSVRNFGGIQASQYAGVSIRTGTLHNYGSISSSGTAYYANAVRAALGGAIVNGSAKSTAALLTANADAIDGAGPTTVANFGTITSAHGYGVSIAGGGAITNGSAKDKTALISGAQGIDADDGALVIKNFATIAVGGYGVHITDGGSLTNGSATDHAATISGGNGVRLGGGASGVNFGVIRGTGGYGVVLGLDSNFTNGSASDTTALISGGLYVYGDDTVVNFGTIDGGGFGNAVEIQSNYATLVVEGGCAFVGTVAGGYSTLDLASGVGKISGGLASGTMTISGSMKPATFTAFDTLQIAGGASFTDVGPFGVAAGQALEVTGSLKIGGAGANTATNAGLIEVFTGGSLTIGGTFTNAGTIEAHGGTLMVSRAASGPGAAVIAGGALEMGSTFAGNVTFTGAGGELQLAKSLAYAGTVSGFSKNGGSSLDLLDIAFVSAGEATYSGTKTGGLLSVSDGVRTTHIALTGNYLNATFVSASDGQGGVTVVAGAPPVAASQSVFVAAMASLGAASGAAGTAAHAPHEAWRPMLARPGAWNTSHL